MSIRALLAQSPIVPVLVIERIEDAAPLASALVEGGIFALEITLRTNAALAALEKIRHEVPAALVGAGTIVNALQLQQSIDAGARFGVSPGLTDELASAIAQSGLPFLPGVASASELMRAAEYGFDTFKLFPAEASGGVALLQSLAGPFPEARFCPTGGVGVHNAQDYLALNNVLAVGGSWLAPAALMAKKDWAGITRLAREAVALKG